MDILPDDTVECDGDLSSEEERGSCISDDDDDEDNNEQEPQEEGERQSDGKDGNDDNIEDDNDDDEEEIDEDESDEGEDDSDDDEEEEEEEDVDSVEDCIRKDFLLTCLRIAKNDATLETITSWKSSFYHGQGWNDMDLFVLGHALTGNTHLRSLQIQNTSRLNVPNDGPHGGVQALCQGIYQTQLKDLKVVGMCDQLQTILFQDIGQMSTLGTLSIWSTELDMNTLTMRPSPFLTDLILMDCPLTFLEMRTLADWISSNPSLVSLKVISCHVTDDGVMYFCENWNSDSPLQKLDFGFNHIAPHGAVTLLNEASGHVAMVKLNINCNFDIGHDGLELLTEQLPDLGFADLNISNCVRELYTSLATQDAACRALSDGLRRNTSLVNLDISGNFLGALGAQMIMQAVSAHPMLESLTL
jgi:hypothetical protein